MLNPPSLKEISWSFQSQLECIKVFLVDIDGILTDGTIYYGGQELGFNRSFHIRDGYGFEILRAAGIKVGFISGGDSLGVRERAKMLKIDYVFLGNKDKREAYKSILNDGYTDSEVLYIGDELFDIPLLKKAGFSASVHEASHEVKEAADYICYSKPGFGVAREVADMVRYAQKIEVNIPDFS